MALKSYYSTGTATVAAGSKAVTGQGTAWSLTLQPGDLFGTHKGLPVRIEAVNSDTSLTLAYVWPGASQTAAAYEVQIVSDADRITGTARDLLVALANGNIASIADLASAADTVPYFTGEGTAALTGLTAFGRSAIGGANVDAILPGRLGAVSKAVTDWNDAIENGFYLNTITTPANAPPTTNPLCAGYVVVHSTNFLSQTVWDAVNTSAVDTAIWRRQRNLGTWGDWYRCRLSEAEQQALWDVRYLGVNAKADDAAKLDGVAPSTFAKTFLDDADAAAARTTLGALASSSLSSGTGWWKIGSLLVQTRSEVVTLNANGAALINFPTAFKAGTRPQVVGVNGDYFSPTTAAVISMAASAQVTATSFTFTVRPSPGAIAWRIDWIAVGEAP